MIILEASSAACRSLSLVITQQLAAKIWEAYWLGLGLRKASERDFAPTKPHAKHLKKCRPLPSWNKSPRIALLQVALRFSSSNDIIRVGSYTCGEHEGAQKGGLSQLPSTHPWVSRKLYQHDHVDRKYEKWITEAYCKTTQGTMKVQGLLAYACFIIGHWF